MTTARASAAPPLKQSREQMLREFTQDMTELVQDRAERSRLRPAARHPMDDPRIEGARWTVFGWMHAPGRDEQLTRPWPVRRAMFLTAGLIAQYSDAPTLQERWHAHIRANGDPDHAPPRGLRFDMGLALAELKRRTDADGGRGSASDSSPDSPYHRRLVHLVRSEPDDLPLPLFRALGYLRSRHADLPSWWQLAADLVQHSYDPGRVALAWQESFLRIPEWRRAAT